MVNSCWFIVGLLIKIGFGRLKNYFEKLKVNFGTCKIFLEITFGKITHFTVNFENLILKISFIINTIPYIFLCIL